MRIMFLALLFFIPQCADIHDNNISAEVSIDFCEAVNTVESKETIPTDDEKKDDPNSLVPEWGDCEFNEDCETNFCMCYRCLDIAKFVGFK